MAVDPSRIKPVRIQKSLLLLNNFVATTSVFLNSFSESCEKKISAISSKVTELEILLAVLEAKLNSIPGLEFNSSDLPSAAAAAPPVAAPSSSQNNQPPSTSSSDAPAPTNAPPAPAAPSAPAAESTTSTSIVVAGPPEGMVAAKDHPDYAGFFKMLRVGVPTPVVANKMSGAGLDASVLDTPEKYIPL